MFSSGVYNLSLVSNGVNKQCTTIDNMYSNKKYMMFAAPYKNDQSTREKHKHVKNNPHAKNTKQQHNILTDNGLLLTGFSRVRPKSAKRSDANANRASKQRKSTKE